MFDVEWYMDKVEKIRNEMLLSKGAMAELLGISVTTFFRLYKGNEGRALSNGTKRTLKKFVEDHGYKIGQ